MRTATRRIARAVAVAGGAALLAAGAAAAQSAVASGTFHGRTDRGTPVAFRVSHHGRALSHFRFSKLRLHCSDGDSFPISGTMGSGRARVRITGAGRFALEVRRDDGGRWTARGRIDGATAAGSLRLRVRFNAGNQVSRNGSVRCDSGRRRFKVRNRSAARRRPQPTFTGKS
jgi:hypothetical protein